MKITIPCIAIVLTFSAATSTFAGGGGASFEKLGLKLLKQSPLLADILTSQFSVEEHGVFGPSDAPFDGQRLYTQMDFRATSAVDEGQRFLIRLHSNVGNHLLSRW